MAAFAAVLSHNTTHQSGGSDAIKLDDLAAPEDNTDLNASTSAHGLLLKATAPASGLLNVVGIGNGETEYANKALFDTTTPAALGTASAGSQLVAARRDHVHAKPALLEKITGGTISGQASLSITTAAAFDGTYDYLELAIWDIECQTDSVDLRFRISDDGSTFEADASDYQYATASLAAAGAGTDTSTGATFIQLTRGAFPVGNASGENGHFFTIKTHLPTGTTYHKHFTWHGHYTRETGAPVGIVGGGEHQGSAAAVLGLQVLASSGNISCSYALYGRRAA